LPKVLLIACPTFWGSMLLFEAFVAAVAGIKIYRKREDPSGLKEKQDFIILNE